MLGRGTCLEEYLFHFGFRAREAWRKHKAWGVSPRLIAKSNLAREAGGSGNNKDIDEPNTRTRSFIHCRSLSRAF